jgi:radical SAM superfamily enzyme YgiQ (UPF0313 family)
VSSSATDHPHFHDIRAWIHQQGKTHSVASLRCDHITPQLLADIRASGHRTLTLAPETGTMRLRHVINKPISDLHIISTAEMIGEAGFRTLKLYFQVGLPEETDEDVVTVSTLVGTIQESLRRGAGSRGWNGVLTVAVNPFVPKPATPFQWEAMNHPDVIKNKLNNIQKQLAGRRGVTFSSTSLRETVLQAAIARGDRRIGEIIGASVGEGKNPLTRLKKGGPGIPALSWFLHRPRPREEPLPWDFIDHGVSKDLLWEERLRAQSGHPTPPCRPGKCQRCEACQSAFIEAGA